jgi:hypothetical protein
MVAPPGIGKTSVISALLAEANEVLSGTPVSLLPENPTRIRLSLLDNEIRGHIQGKTFVGTGIKNTQGNFEYRLNLQTEGLAQPLALQILDYPGRLVAEQEGAAWQGVQQWFAQSDILILPIDATLLMESVLHRHKAILAQVLNLAEVERVAAIYWARQRVANGRGAGKLVLVPVKCESYFADNGGTVDHSSRLYGQVTQWYGPIVDAVLRESPLTQVLYCPIDTLGCVELVRVDWKPHPETHFKARSSTVARRGAADLFVTIVDQIFSNVEAEQAARARAAAEDAQNARKEADRDRGVVGNFLAWFRGERDQLRIQAAEKVVAAQREQDAALKLARTLESVRKRPRGARLRAVGG